ncbi:hypothetical protein Tco_1069129 [Tanacetum coccineum]|uniref:Uncharacterized protein n=1 Tax=Tanacetum coccineum TaxID=301880 RepID=A0ABQ5HJL2_9ASTR
MVRLGIVRTEIQLVLEHTQQGTSNEVSVTTYAVKITWLIADIEDKYHGPSDKLRNPSKPLKIPQRILVSFLMEINAFLSSLSLCVLPEHPSDTKVLTMKMEILLEPTSNKLLVGIPDGSSCCFHNSDVCYHDPEKYEHADPMVTTLHGGNTKTRMIKRFTVADDLKESSNITQVKGTKFKDHYIMYKEIKA